jgi:hypothetical protein
MLNQNLRRGYVSFSQIGSGGKHRASTQENPGIASMFAALPSRQILDRYFSESSVQRDDRSQKRDCGCARSGNVRKTALGIFDSQETASRSKHV